MKNLILLPYTFVLMNWAAVVGLYHFLQGQHDVWSGYESLDSLPKESRRHGVSDRREPDFSDAA